MHLSTNKLANAVEYNFANAKKLGWLKNFGQVLSAIGNENAVTPEKFALAVAQWQANQKPNLVSDGKLGPNTWKKMKRGASAGTGGTQIPEWLKPTPPKPLTLVGGGVRWMQIALGEKQTWDTEISTMSTAQKKIAEQYMSRDEEYFQASPYFGAKVKERNVVPKNTRRSDWCAAFVNWCLHSAGFSHTGSAGANSFIVPRLWRFDALDEPKRGCVIVVGDGNRGAHVAFLWESSGLPNSPNGHVVIRGKRDRKLRILGGNQSQRISVMNERRRMLSCRGHNGVTSPYLWPRQGAPNCNHVPETLRAHFCGHIHSD